LIAVRPQKRRFFASIVTNTPEPPHRPPRPKNIYDLKAIFRNRRHFITS
jgi:hypothetical protein